MKELKQIWDIMNNVNENENYYEEGKKILASSVSIVSVSNGELIIERTERDPSKHVVIDTPIRKTIVNSRYTEYMTAMRLRQRMGGVTTTEAFYFVSENEKHPKTLNKEGYDAKMKNLTAVEQEEYKTISTLSGIKEKV